MIISKRNSFLVLIVPDMKCSYLSVLLVYATQCTANYVALAILIGMYQLINYIHARRGNAWVHICSVTQQSSRTAPLQAQSAIQFRIASPATRDCLSWHWILWHLLPLKPVLNDYSRCVVIWQQENGTVLRCPCVGGISKTELSHSVLNSIYCELKCNLFLVL